MASGGSPSASAAVPPLATALGVLAMTVGLVLSGLTLAGAAAGYAAIGFFDLTIGAMFLYFSAQSTRFGYRIATGRLTMAEAMRSRPKSAV